MKTLNHLNSLALSLAFVISMMALPASWQKAEAARNFKDINITVDLSRAGVIDPKSTITKPSEVQDRAFIKMDLKVIVDKISARQLLKIVDQGIDDEPSGCQPGKYDPLDMEDGLRYFFQVNSGNKQVRATIYPGERSRNPFNDVFCEYNKKLGEKKAVFRVRGFFFVRHSDIPGGIDIQLRPVRPTSEETEKYFQ